jgi:hypothetical protein
MHWSSSCSFASLNVTTCSQVIDINSAWHIPGPWLHSASLVSHPHPPRRRVTEAAYDDDLLGPPAGPLHTADPSMKKWERRRRRRTFLPKQSGENCSVVCVCDWTWAVDTTVFSTCAPPYSSRQQFITWPSSHIIGVAVCWRLVLKCFELRTRQHKMLDVNILRPSKHYFLKDIMIFGRRLWRTYLHQHKI